jgi:chemotaxis response regulator CheB
MRRPAAGAFFYLTSPFIGHCYIPFLYVVDFKGALSSDEAQEPAIKVLGEASNLAETISMAVALKQDVILLDLHMPDDHSFNPEFVKASPLRGARVLAMSLASDYESEEETRLLAENFGAVRTLDKAKLCDELIPAILQTEN